MRRTCLAFYFCLAAFTLTPAGASENGSVQSYYGYNLETKGVRALLKINDIVLDRQAKASAMNGSSGALGMWARTGSNPVEIIILESSQPKEAGAASVKLTVKQVDKDGEKAGPETSLLDFAWEQKGKETFPLVLKTQFEIKNPLPAWAWEKGDVFTNANLPKEAIYGYVRELIALLNKKDFAGLAPYLRVKTEELSLAQHVPLQEGLTDQEQFFKSELFSDPKWSMVPLKGKSLVFNLHAGGRLVEVVDAKGGSPVHTGELKDEGTFSLKLFLARINGKWTLCR